MLSAGTIETLCGPEAYKIGREYFRLGLVGPLTKTENGGLEAVVDGRERYKVTVEFKKEGGPEAKCGCPSFFAHFHYCSHIAAVLLQVLADQGGQTDSGSADSKEDAPGSFSFWESKERRAAAKAAPLIRSSSSALNLANNGGTGASDATGGYGATGRTFISAEESRHERTANALMALLGGDGKEGSKGQVIPTGPAAPAKYVQEDFKLLKTEFTCHLEEGLFAGRNPRFYISMKAGEGRLYAIRDLRLFLEHVEQGKPLPLSKGFDFNPAEHRFTEAAVRVLKILISVCAGERVYGMPGGYSVRPSAGKKPSAADLKQLLIPPFVWESLAVALEEAEALLEQPGGFTAPLALSNKKPPIVFELKKQSEQTFELEAECLEETVLLPAYKSAVFRGNIYKVSPAKLELLDEIKTLLFRRDMNGRLELPEGQLEMFTQRVIPRLKTLGSVSIDRSIESRIIEPRLQAKLFLDREGDRLHIRLEYHYHGIILYPVGPDSRQTELGSSILLRDLEKEQLLLNPFDSLGLAVQGNEWIATTEDAIHEVLFHVVPQIERLAEVFATQSVRDWVHPDQDTFHAAVDADASLNWLEFSFSMDGIQEQDIRKLLLAVVERKHFYKLPGGAFVNLDGEGFSAFTKVYKDLGLRRQDLGSSIRVPLVKAFYLDDSYGKSISRGRTLARFLEQIREPERLEVEVPASLKGIMRDFQKQGFYWLKALSRFRMGGILADDMGLGKTLQTIAFLLSEQEEAEKQPELETMPALILAPASVIYNWENEFTKFSPALRVRVIAGSREEREKILRKSYSEVDVLVTSYPLLRRDVELYANYPFSTMILDEAQAFKNHATQTAAAVKAVQAGRRFALTGTPVENSLDELWSILDAVFPELFTGRKEFRDMPREKLSRAIRPFILRRVKSEVLAELPEKIETVVSSELTADQKKLYGVYLRRLQKQAGEDLALEGFQKSRLKILAGITRLRQICCYPGLFIDNYEGSSGKLEQLLEIIEECMAAGKRLLIFSQFTGMLAKIREELGGRGLPYFYLDGQTPAKERVEMCSRFNEGEHDLFLISLKAGGTGLNLTGADTVILFDLWWNPAVEEQAMGRAHRLGQKHTVQVIRLTAKGTIEDKMLELQQRKKDLIQDVIEVQAEADSKEALSWSEEDIRELLMIP